MSKREEFVNLFASWVGCVQGDATHKHIIDTYNKFVSARKTNGSLYIMKYNDAWCMATVSAAAILTGLAPNPIQTECSCTRDILLLDGLGEWVENDNFVPSAGDLIFFKWDLTDAEMSGMDDVHGIANHVGIVEKVENGNIHTIEGNRNGRVARRVIPIGWTYIRGFGHIKFPDEKIEKEYYIVQKGDNLTKIANAYNTTVEAIMKLNPLIINKNLIFRGQKIRVK